MWRPVSAIPRPMQPQHFHPFVFGLPMSDREKVMRLKVAKYASTTLLILLAFASQSASAQQFVSIDASGATSTGISQINNHGQMVGSYTDSAGVTHGLLLNAGVVTTIDYPGAAGTFCQSINDSGQ